MRTIALTIFLLMASLASPFAAADQLKLVENAPEVYVVKEGDTLWEISGMYLQDPWLWPEIWDINEQVNNPHLIFPGDELYLVWIDGRPRLRVRRGPGSNTVKMTPQMRIEPIDRAIPSIPLEQIGAWLKGHRIVSPEEIGAAPYVVAGSQRHLLSAQGDSFYVRGTLPPNESGFGIFRPGETYIDPVTEELLGYQALDIGSATLKEQNDGDISNFEVTRVTEEVRKGDRMLPNEARNIETKFQPHAPDFDVDGLMISVDGGVSQIGTMDVVAINRGSREGMEAGHVLAIFQKGEIVTDEIARERVMMPDVRAGLVMVFRAFEKMSYGIVLKSNRPLAVNDRVSNP